LNERVVTWVIRFDELGSSKWRKTQVVSQFIASISKYPEEIHNLSVKVVIDLGVCSRLSKEY
jgi:hypothetical protein